MANETMIAFWLTLAAGARQFFEELIAEIAQRCDAPAFEPHVTLCGGEVSEERAAEILRALSLPSPIQLEVAGIDFSEQYTKTLFVQFRASAEIEALAHEIRRTMGSDHELNPHLSLLYKEMPAAEKAELARTITLPADQVLFDAIKVISTPHPITRREQVEAWRTLGARTVATSSESMEMRKHVPPEGRASARPS